MFRYNTQFMTTPPAFVVFQGFRRKFFDLTREQWDELGYNEALPIERERFTTYETRWSKGEDLIYREEIVTATLDEDAKAEQDASNIRAQRDRLLADCDWTQLADSTLDDQEMVLWQSYRQALRDLPQQVGFPQIVEWPEAQMAE